MLVVRIHDPGGVVYKSAVWKCARARRRHPLQVEIFRRGGTVWVISPGDGLSLAFAYSVYLKARARGLEASLLYMGPAGEDWIPEKVRQAAEKWLSQDLTPADAVSLKEINIAYTRPGAGGTDPSGGPEPQRRLLETPPHITGNLTGSSPSNIPSSYPSNLTGKGAASPSAGPAKASGGIPRDSPSGDPGTGEKRRRIVRWVKVDRVRDLGTYFQRIQEREGREVLWSDRGDGWACWAFREDVEGVVEELNREKWPLNDIQRHGEGRELYDCGLIMFKNGEWAAIS